MSQSNDGCFVSNVLSEASLYEQFAEECVELAHACQKKARKLRGENPTPIEMDAIEENIIEEYTDVQLVASILDIHKDDGVYWNKYERWCQRLSS